MVLRISCAVPLLYVADFVSSPMMSIRPPRSSHFISSCWSKDRQAIAGEDALLDKRAGGPKTPLYFQPIHVGEVLGNEGLYRAGRRSDALIATNRVLFNIGASSSATVLPG
jgi:hypothetical protein